MWEQLYEMADNAQLSAKVLAGTLAAEKTKALLLIADSLEEHYEEIIFANNIDLKNAVENGLSSAMQDRLMLNKERIWDMAKAVREVAELPDPVGVILSGSTRPNGLEIIKKTVPLGVIAVIFESRPNVTVDCTVLCLKSGNACILRGGSEAISSNKALATIIRNALKSTEIPVNSVQLIADTSRETSNKLMQLNGKIDLLIPRGGKGLIRAVVDNATVPVIETGAGMCHIYVDESADLEMALNIASNAKLTRPSVCNAMETLLVHSKNAEAFLPMVRKCLTNVEFHSCDYSLPLLGDNAVLATDEDWSTEYDDFILNVKVVKNLEEAINHIDRYSTHHSETIVSNSAENAQAFLNTVDSAVVYHNASTRYSDGGEFGLGAEIGISTQKLHVRGPMGLEALTSYKYIVRGSGQVRE